MTRIGGDYLNCRSSVDLTLSNGTNMEEKRLSDRETSVVRLVAEGCTNKEIGGLLNMSLKTVETHRAAAMRKLRLSSLAGLVRYAVAMV